MNLKSAVPFRAVCMSGRDVLLDRSSVAAGASLDLISTSCVLSNFLGRKVLPHLSSHPACKIPSATSNGSKFHPSSHYIQTANHARPFHLAQTTGKVQHHPNTQP
jgi:hypothetical protein